MERAKMKRLKDLIAEAAPQGVGVTDPGTKKFLDAHPIIPPEKPAGSPEADDELFNAKSIKHAVLKTHDIKHGHATTAKSQAVWKGSNGKEADIKITEDELHEAHELAEMYGMFGAFDKDVKSPEHHNELYNNFFNRAREHKIQAVGHESFLNSDRKLSKDEKKFHEDSMALHWDLHDLNHKQATRQLELLDQAHKAAAKDAKKKRGSN
jgi:hypothetical protein